MKRMMKRRLVILSKLILPFWRKKRNKKIGSVMRSNFNIKALRYKTIGSSKILIGKMKIRVTVKKIIKILNIIRPHHPHLSHLSRLLHLPINHRKS